MSRVIDKIDDHIIHEDIQVNTPGSDKVDSRTFSMLLDDDKVVASYKMYWLLCILDALVSLIT